MKFAAAVIALTICLAPAAPTGRVIEPDPAIDYARENEHIVVGVSFPAVANAAELTITRRHLDSLGAKDVRINELWSLRKPTQDGQFFWEPLDRRIDSLTAAGVRIMLTVEANGPAWECGVSNPRSCVYSDLNSFRAYVDSIGRRYGHRLDAIQFGNEVYSSYWYAGQAADFVAASNAFYSVIKARHPNLPVVLAGMQISLLHALAVCQHGKIIPQPHPTTGAPMTMAQVQAMCADTVTREMLSRFTTITLGARYDLVDIHLYDNVEYFFDYVESVRQALPGKLIIASEYGLPHRRFEPADPAYQASRLSLGLRGLPLLRLKKVMYFRMTVYTPGENADHQHSGLLNLDGTRRPAYFILREHNLRIVP